ncbi:hypothetical protein N7451_003516 [Penicillium sp. IBT 35674x]|nr:hypothetical protein N7451_003516 [Penicillium sp. IBT 35674x]
MDSCDFDIALKLFLDDVTKIEAERKGKNRADDQGDDDFAIQCMKGQILSIQTAKDDRVLPSVVTTDGSAVSFIRHDERIATRDRKYALALESSETPDPNLLHTMKHTKYVDSISLAMGYLSARMKEEDLVDSGEGPSHIGTRQRKVKCTSCLDKWDDIAFSGGCGHQFCQECTRRLILSTRSEALYPPRCCGQVIPPMVVLSALSYYELQIFSDKAVEYNTMNRVYCADPKCSDFIITLLSPVGMLNVQNAPRSRICNAARWPIQGSIVQLTKEVTKF